MLGVSTDSVDTLNGWKRDKKLQYDLLSDPDHNFLEAWGAWGVPVLSLIKIPMAMRSYWVIDEQGKVVWRSVNNSLIPTDKLIADLGTVVKGSSN